jgi:triosephosphate isomerase
MVLRQVLGQNYKEVMTKKVPLIAGNWKMNQNHLEAMHLIEEIDWELKDVEYDFSTGEVLIIPPFTDIRSAQMLFDAEKMQMSLGAQDVSTHVSGAYTGEVSASMLQTLSVDYVLVGHSERRMYHAENDPTLLADKIRRILEAKMKPIFCVGESLEIREKGEHVPFVLNQTLQVLRSFEADEIKDLVVAYEPVWAIGTGKTASEDDAEEMAFAIREAVKENFGSDFASKLRIQYGGSVKSGTALSIMSKPNVDGLLIGGASLVGSEFAKIVRIAAKAKE